MIPKTPFLQILSASRMLAASFLMGFQSGARSTFIKHLWNQGGQFENRPNTERLAPSHEVTPLGGAASYMTSHRGPGNVARPFLLFA